MRRLLYTTAAILGFGACVALGQSIVQQALTGNEAILFQAGGPGGTGGFTNVTALRNAVNYTSLPTQTTLTQTISPNIGQIIVTGAITTLNLSMPSAPYDGQIVALSCPGGSVTTIIWSAPTPVLNPATVITSAANQTGCTSTIHDSSFFKWTYQSSPSTWYRVQ